MHLEKLNAHHDTSAFDCGQDALNDYFRKYALINQKMRISQTYVGVDQEIIGFYSLAVASVKHTDAPKKIVRGLPRFEVPVMLLARLAVAKERQGQGIGSGLLKDAILRTQQVADLVGIRALLVHAKNDDVASWYRRFDFEQSPIDHRHLFLLIKEIEAYL